MHVSTISQTVTNDVVVLGKASIQRKKPSSLSMKIYFIILLDLPKAQGRI